jgi:hypothetical protein
MITSLKVHFLLVPVPEDNQVTSGIGLKTLGNVIARALGPGI